MDLLLHQHPDTFRVAADPAGIHHYIRSGPHSSDTILPIAGQSGLISNQGIPAAGKTIKQGRFTHIGTTDEYDDLQHVFSLRVREIISP